MLGVGTGLQGQGCRGMGRVGLAVTVLLGALVGGCGWPRDPEGASARIEGKVLRAGAAENPPWVRFRGEAVEGLEADLVREAAAEMHARVVWIRGPESQLMKDLKDQRLDLVAAGVDEQNPWVKELGATQPYVTVADEKHVLVVPPGENGWLLRLDRFLQERRLEVLARLPATKTAS